VTIYKKLVMGAGRFPSRVARGWKWSSYIVDGENSLFLCFIEMNNNPKERLDLKYVCSS
jgi:hypothetical protein